MNVSSWTAQDWVLVLGALAAAIVAIIKAVKSDAKVEALTSRVDSQAQSIRENRSDMTNLAMNMPSPSPDTEKKEGVNEQ